MVLMNCWLGAASHAANGCCTVLHARGGGEGHAGGCGALVSCHTMVQTKARPLSSTLLSSHALFCHAHHLSSFSGMANLLLEGAVWIVLIG